jgi:lipopolysaccharide heptosyltransferase II
MDLPPSSSILDPLSVPPPRRILVRGVNWLGDAVMTTPALQRLRERFPEAHIALLTPEKLAGLWFDHPSLNAALTFASGATPWSIARRLLAERFDTAVVLPNSPRSALEPWLARIPVRLGYGRPWRNWFLTHPLSPRPGRHRMRKRTAGEIRRLVGHGEPPAPGEHRTPAEAGPLAHQIHEFLHLVAALGADSVPVPPHLFVAPGEIEAIASHFGLPAPARPGAPRLPTSPGPLLGLNPGAEYGPAKRWPLESFVAAAAEIQKRTGCAWIIFGGKSDVRIASTIHSALHTPRSTVLNLAGQTSLRQLMALLKLCRLLLSNDTGPMHVAAALGTPVVVPFGSTSPELTGPGLPGDRRHHLLQANAPCAPCFRRSCPIDFRCMTALSPDQIAAAVLRALA